MATWLQTDLAATAHLLDALGEHMLPGGVAVCLASIAGQMGADDAAIDTTKRALLPGQISSSANFTVYSTGINGIMVDVDGLPEASEPSATDFLLHVGNTTDAAAWPAAASPELVFTTSPSPATPKMFH